MKSETKNRSEGLISLVALAKKVRALNGFQSGRSNVFTLSMSAPAITCRIGVVGLISNDDASIRKFDNRCSKRAAASLWRGPRVSEL
jgi:hypothetical protein